MLAALVLLGGCDRSGPGSTSMTDDSAGEADAAVPASTAAPEESPLSSELRVALERLLVGSESRADSSWFSERTRGALRSATVNSAGHAIVDFHDLRNLIPNASSSAGSSMLVQQLNATVFGLSGVESVEYQMNHSCDLFWEWLQQSCHVVKRDTAQPGK